MDRRRLPDEYKFPSAYIDKPFAPVHKISDNKLEKIKIAENVIIDYDSKLAYKVLALNRNFEGIRSTKIRELDTESFELAIERVNQQMASVEVELSNVVPQISNSAKLILESLKKLAKLAIV